jgi:hypothetical protein
MTKINMNEIIMVKMKMFKRIMAKPTMVKLLTMNEIIMVKIEMFKIIMAKPKMDHLVMV